MNLEVYRRVRPKIPQRERKKKKKKKTFVGLHSRNEWGQENGENRELSIHKFTPDKTCTVHDKE